MRAINVDGIIFWEFQLRDVHMGVVRMSSEIGPFHILSEVSLEPVNE